MKIREFTFEEYLEKVKEFHGNIDPGVVAGSVMLDIARENLPDGDAFDVICETGHSLPDAVQILMPCTIGNGRLKIVETSRVKCVPSGRVKRRVSQTLRSTLTGHGVYSTTKSAALSPDCKT